MDFFENNHAGRWCADNEIDSPKAVAIAQAVIANRTGPQRVQFLNLNSNRIGPVGAQALAWALELPGGSIGALDLSGATTNPCVLGRLAIFRKS